MIYKLTRIYVKYGWNSDSNESKKFEIEDEYDPMDWDDLTNNIGYLLEGHKGQDVILKIRGEEEK